MIHPGPISSFLFTSRRSLSHAVAPTALGRRFANRNRPGRGNSATATRTASSSFATATTPWSRREENGGRFPAATLPSRSFSVRAAGTDPPSHHRPTTTTTTTTKKNNRHRFLRRNHNHHLRHRLPGGAARTGFRDGDRHAARVASSSPVTSTEESSSSPAAASAITEEEQNGAWIVLSALEKAKEKERVAVAKRVSRMEKALPPGLPEDRHRTASAELRRRRNAAAATGASPRAAAPPVSNNKETVSLPDVVARARKSAESFEGNPWWGIHGDDVRVLLHATRHGKRIDLQTVVALVEGATAWLRIFRRNTKLVCLPPLRRDQTLTVVGDLHGSLSDLATVLQVMPGEEPAEDNRLLFNGDLADRGEHGIETICIVCALCLAYPQHVMVNRGNHEDLVLAVAYDLVAELRAKYFGGDGGDEADRNAADDNDNEYLLSMTKTLLDNFFRALPLATLVEDDALIVHAGPPPPGSPPIRELLCNVRGGRHPVLAGKGLSRTIVDSVGSVCPSLRESQAVIESLLWSDPWVDETGTVLMEEVEEEAHHRHRQHQKQQRDSTTAENKDDDPPPILGWHPNLSRGAGSRYDAGVVRRFLRNEGLTRMVRSHEPVQRGCARYAIGPEHPAAAEEEEDGGSRSPQPAAELFTVFSASRYPRKEGFNQGAILELRADGEHHITRYATEDDDPIPLTAPRTDDEAVAASLPPTTTEEEEAATMTTTTPGDDLRLPSHHASFHHHRPSSDRCFIGIATIRENLFGAIRRHEGEVFRSLRTVAMEGGMFRRGSPVLTADAIVESLVHSLKLDGDAVGLRTRDAKTVLATALGLAPPPSFGRESPEDVVVVGGGDDTVELEAFCRSLRQRCRANDDECDGSGDENENGGGSDDDPWLSSVFDLLDADGDGTIDRSEWGVRATSDDRNRFDDDGVDGRPDRIWDLLDANGDGKLSPSEWERRLVVVDDDDDEDDVLQEG